MPPNFDDQLERLLHRYADPVQPTHDLFSQIQQRLHAQTGSRTGSRRVLPSGMRRPMAVLVATVSLVVVVALFGALFLSLRGGAGHGPQACAPLAAPTTPGGVVSGRAPLAGGTLEVTRTYIGDDFMAINYRITGSATSPIRSTEIPGEFYLRDGQGQYVGNHGQSSWGTDEANSYADGNVVFPSFAQPEAPGAQTLFFGWFPTSSSMADGTSAHEVAFQARVVRGAVSHPHVTPAKAGRLTLQLVDLTINRTPNPVLTPSVEMVRLHLRFSGLPTAPACDTVVTSSFHSTGGAVIQLEKGGRGGPGPFGEGDRSALTFPDGASGPPAFANLAGRPYFVAGYPTVRYPWYSGIDLRPEDQGQMDMVAVFYAPQVPQDGTLTFTLDELRFGYQWDESTGGQPAQRTRDYRYAGPWTLRIPLSGA
jgi:hypothetical protein